VAELARNLRICISEKTRKVSRVRAKYPIWWLSGASSGGNPATGTASCSSVRSIQAALSRSSDVRTRDPSGGAVKARRAQSVDVSQVPIVLFVNAVFSYRAGDNREVAVQTGKQEVQALLQELPDDATLEDIQYRIYVKQKIAQGLADVRAGRVVSQEEVEKRFARWLEK
jgi:hypothetical protein